MACAPNPLFPPGSKANRPLWNPCRPFQPMPRVRCARHRGRFALEPGGNRGFDDAEEQEMRSCCCPSCGAELVCDHATIAASCPCCDNPTVIRSRVAGALRPDLVIPFKLEKDAAVAALKKHYVKRPFLPRCFKDENRIQSIKGIYVPFFLFDYTASGISDLYSK